MRDLICCQQEVRGTLHHDCFKGAFGSGAVIQCHGLLGLEVVYGQMRSKMIRK